MNGNSSLGRDRLRRIKYHIFPRLPPSLNMFIFYVCRKYFYWPCETDHLSRYKVSNVKPLCHKERFIINFEAAACNFEFVLQCNFLWIYRIIQQYYIIIYYRVIQQYWIIIYKVYIQQYCIIIYRFIQQHCFIIYRVIQQYCIILNRVLR